MAKQVGVLKFNMKNAEAGGGGAHRYPEGVYVWKVMKVSSARSKSNAENTVVTFNAKILLPESYKGKDFTFRETISEKGMFRWAQLFDAMKIKWSKKLMSVPTEKFVGAVFGGQLVDGEPYGNQKRISSQVAEYYDRTTARGLAENEEPEDEEDEDIEEEEVEEDEDEDEEEEDLEELDEDDL